jgi:hypothetical protein
MGLTVKESNNQSPSDLYGDNGYDFMCHYNIMPLEESGVVSGNKIFLWGITFIDILCSALIWKAADFHVVSIISCSICILISIFAKE